MRYSESVMFRVEPEVKFALERIAEAEGRSVGNLVRVYIVQRLTEDGQLEPTINKSKTR